MKKKFIVVTGGAGFIGSNLILYLLNKTNYDIISIDNYSTGKIKNHVKSRRVEYINSDTQNISNVLSRYKNKINSVFHFGEFSRIFQSFLKLDQCIQSNSVGTHAVFSYCFKNKIKLIYSATSATIGNNGSDKNLSPYAFTKAKNLEMLENLKKWFNFKFEIIYFYNVYGPNQISKGSMATVIGIFQYQYKKRLPLTVVKPGTQSRMFTHVDDTVKVCYLAWKKNKCRHYSISSRESYSIMQVAKLFKSKIKLVPKRDGERFASALTHQNLSNKIYRFFGKIKLIDYINNFINK
jgi:UDP-glucose 4-epimerase